MAFASVESLVDVLRDHRLLKPPQLDELNRVLKHQHSSSATLAKEVVRRGWLTVFQMNQLFKDNGQELVLGPYRILDQLGKGGVAQVFKAWHIDRHCLVALKVIHAELLSNPEAVARFEREIHLACQLDHANIVRAIEEPPEKEGTRFYAMEFVEGINLAQQVQLSGPLAVPKACDAIRQAALGLQHAHEHGLVHRDIKPSNLFLVAGSSLVKILDLGLARLQSQGASGQVINLTVEGRMIGSPDYVAPEQGRDARSVDIRADIYSLGCTFYFLLTGQPPFPGTSFMAKMLQHCQEEPVPVEKQQPGVPEALGNIIRKMMAKKPANRYQTPAEAAAAVEPFCL